MYFMPSITVCFNLSTQAVLDLYQSSAANIKTTTLDGRSVMFPKRLLRSMVTHQGIRGTFRIDYNEQGQLTGVERVMG